MSARASVIVRCKDEEKLLERALTSLRRQTVEPEIVVVDSGSTDRSLEIAKRWCDRLVEIPAESFTHGYALNVGARLRRRRSTSRSRLTATHTATTGSSARSRTTSGATSPPCADTTRCPTART